MFATADLVYGVGLYVVVVIGVGLVGLALLAHFTLMIMGRNA